MSDLITIEVEDRLSFSHETGEWSGPVPSFEESRPKSYMLRGWTERPDRTAYVEMVKKAKSYIEAGDVYQVNLARWFCCRFDGDAFGYFCDLMHVNPSPYAAYVELPEMTIVSLSPELLFQKKGSRIVTRPIAGTYPKDKPPELLTRDPKERAEHIMLIDLERNDLGRIAIPGTVAVEELLTTEEYSHLHHIVSQVAAEVRPEVTYDEILRAIFPGGTITGAPKIRAMQIIDELEHFQRGLYTGSIGLIDKEGDMTFNIAIRTAVIREGQLYLAAGAGIVADSDPEREADETRLKVAVFLEG